MTLSEPSQDLLTALHTHDHMDGKDRAIAQDLFKLQDQNSRFLDLVEAARAVDRDARGEGGLALSASICCLRTALSDLETYGDIKKP